jgi:hypothetical protein
VKLAAIVLAHHDPAQLALLLSALDHPAVRRYLHVDARVEIAPFVAEIKAAGVRDVVLVPRYPSRWGGIEVVDAILGGLERAVAEGCGYFVLLSGQDLPLWPTDRIVSFFAETPARSYVESFPLPDPRWLYQGRLRTDFYTYTVLGRRETCVPWGVTASVTWRGWMLNMFLRIRGVLKPPRRFPTYVRPFGGSCWWNLTRDAVYYTLEFLRKHPDFRIYHEHTLLPDELFFPSILMGTAFASTHEIVNDALRFMIWRTGESHPKMLGLEDLPILQASGKPFGRKFQGETGRLVYGHLIRGSPVPAFVSSADNPAGTTE